MGDLIRRAQVCGIGLVASIEKPGRILSGSGIRVVWCESANRRANEHSTIDKGKAADTKIEDE
jgi:hypothetical protein